MAEIAEYQPATQESIWAAFRETDRLIKEFDREMKESRSEYDRRIKKLEETMGSWSNNHGSFAEEYFFNSFENGKPTITKTNGTTFEYQRTSLTPSDNDVINKMYDKREAKADVFLTKIEPFTNAYELTGEMIYEGYPPVTEYGIYYGEKGTSSFIYCKSTNKDSNNGKYTVQLTGLDPNKTYEAGAMVEWLKLTFLKER